MKINELRVGNYYDHNGEIKTVTPNTIQEVFESERSWCKPILLTEEWMIQFGFKKEDLGDEPPYEQFVLETKSHHPFEVWPFTYDGKKIEHWIVDMCDQGGFTTDHFKFVHQLQNFYFAITGEELVVNF